MIEPKDIKPEAELLSGFVTRPVQIYAHTANGNMVDGIIPRHRFQITRSIHFYPMSDRFLPLLKNASA